MIARVVHCSVGKIIVTSCAGEKDEDKQKESIEAAIKLGTVTFKVAGNKHRAKKTAVRGETDILK